MYGQDVVLRLFNFDESLLNLDLLGIPPRQRKEIDGRDKAESVHLSDFPKCNEAMIDKTLEEQMQIAQDISSMVLALRRKVNIKVRQPLQTIMVPVTDIRQKEHIEAVKNLILSEVNVKELNFADNSAGILVKKIKPDFKKLGPRYGKVMKQLAAAIQAMTQEDIASLEQNGSFAFNLDGLEGVNLKPVKLRGELSQGMLLFADNGEKLEIVTSEAEDGNQIR